MGNKTNDKKYKVNPTGEGNQYSDTALGNLFIAHITKITAEKQLIWQRYSAMLIANSIAIGFLTSVIDSTSPVLTLGAAIFGFIVCILWFLITNVGWEYLNKRLDCAGQFKWEGYPNPSEIIYPTIKGSGRDIVKWCAYLLITLFLLTYLILGIISAIKLSK